MVRYRHKFSRVFSRSTTSRPRHREPTTIENDSSYSFQQINLAPVDQVTWGSNLIPDMLLPSESLHISQIDCGNYDVRLTTDAGSECILSNLSLCFDNAIWTIDNTELASCAF